MDEKTSTKPEEEPIKGPSLEDRVKWLEEGQQSFRESIYQRLEILSAKLDTLIAVKTNAVEPAVASVAPPAAEPPVSKTAAVSGPVAATVPVANLPAASLNVKVEDIEAIVQDRTLFTPVLKLNAILDLCERKRLEVA